MRNKGTSSDSIERNFNVYVSMTECWTIGFIDDKIDEEEKYHELGN